MMAGGISARMLQIAVLTATVCGVASSTGNSADVDPAPFQSSELASKYWELCKSQLENQRSVNWFANPKTPDELPALIFCHRALESLIFEFKLKKHSYGVHIKPQQESAVSCNGTDAGASACKLEQAYRLVVAAIDHLTVHAERYHDRGEFRDALGKFGKSFASPVQIDKSTPLSLRGTGSEKCPGSSMDNDQMMQCYPAINRFLRQARVHKALTEKDRFKKAEQKADTLVRVELFTFLKGKAEKLVPEILKFHSRHGTTDAVIALNSSLEELHRKLDKLAVNGSSPLGPILTIQQVEMGDIGVNGETMSDDIHLRCDITELFKTGCSKSKNGLTKRPGGCVSKGSASAFREELLKIKELPAKCRILSDFGDFKVRVAYKCETRFGRFADIKSKNIPKKNAEITFAKDKKIDIDCPNT